MKIAKLAGTYNIRSYECDRNNNLRILTLMNIFQDMADNHACHLGLGIEYVLARGLAWVGSNYMLEIDRLPQMHENIRIETWPSEQRRIGAIRDFEVFGEDGKSITRACSQWILIDFARKRPVSLKDNLPEYEVLDEHALIADFPKIPEAESNGEDYKFRVRFDDIDINRHVNNAVYILWACEAVDAEFRLEHNPHKINVAFKKEGHMGEKIRVITKQDGLHTVHGIYAYGGEDDRELARVDIEWIQKKV